MGQVWKAFDATLERYVALKVLPTELTHEPDRLARFEQEARLLAALNHPNVAVVHGLHRARDVRFVTMELVDGEDLAAFQARRPAACGRAQASASADSETRFWPTSRTRGGCRRGKGLSRVREGALG